MSRIRGSGTKPELRVLEICRNSGRRYFRNRADLPGKPDFVFPKGKIALFVNGCFWHTHDCAKGQTIPVANAEFWRAKRQKTVERDIRQNEQLETLGYEVQIIWECETTPKPALEERLNEILHTTKQ